MNPPTRFDRELPVMTLNVVLVEEPNPPQGCEPIRWLLVTTLPIDTLEDVQRVVDFYSKRWQIEIYFRTLKSGCRIERRLFEKLPRTMNCVALYSIIAWRVMYLCYLGRECPDLDCELLFSPSEWKSVYSVVHDRQLTETPPRLNDLIRMIATLGGYVDRPKTEPGPQTLWTGLQRLHCFSLAWDNFGPET
ncbi:MAG: IS4 family transposase [Fuerstiella sp.]